MLKILHTVAGWLGYIPKAKERRIIREIFLLEQENDKLIAQIKELQDENGSLWDMLDEIKKSDIANHTNNKMELENFLDKLKDAMTEEMLKDFKPVGEA